MRFAVKVGATIALCSAALVGCAELSQFSEPTKPLTADLSINQDRDAPAADGMATSDDEVAAPGTRPLDRPGAPTEVSGAVTGGVVRERIPGTGRFVRQGRAESTAQVINRDGAIVLNFENADLREVVRSVLGETLSANYLLDPRVQGTVNMLTTQPLPLNSLLATLETMLRMNGAALLFEDGLYRIVPVQEAIGGVVSPQLGESPIALPPGFAVRVVPLRHISAIQMEKILDPFLPPEGVLRVDIDRNLLVLAGTSSELETLLNTVSTFDVDWLAGMSVGLYPITFVDAETLSEELQLALRSDEEGPLAGLLQFIPLQRLNALLVVTPRASYLSYVETWIDRLDQGSAAGQNLYVYYLQYGSAASVAQVLGDVFSGTGRRGQERRGEVAPGLSPVEIRSKSEDGAAPAETAAEAGQQPRRGATASRGAGASDSEKIAVTGSEEIRIIADEINNSLLILATPQEYRLVEAAIRKIDIVPLQVLIEATIVEVTLNDELRLGLQWFFKSGRASGTLSTRADGSIASVFPGFSAILAAPDLKLVLDALEDVTTIKVVSSPQLLVQDNQSAELQVGDEVPVATQQQQSPTGITAPLVNTIEFRDTGVILRVTPRVNAGGAVSLEVELEVSDVFNAESLTPTISQRRIKSTISVQSGDTIVLGGLISEDNERSKSGLPGLSQIPIVGLLFGQTAVSRDRTELLVLITPTLVRSSGDARGITEELTRKLNVLKTFDELIEEPRSGVRELFR